LATIDGTTPGSTSKPKAAKKAKDKDKDKKKKDSLTSLASLGE
jgi:hypothetical protein